jgi:hypothetical protein
MVSARAWLSGTKANKHCHLELSYDRKHARFRSLVRVKATPGNSDHKAGPGNSKAL